MDVQETVSEKYDMKLLINLYIDSYIYLFVITGLFQYCYYSNNFDFKKNIELSILVQPPG